MVCVEAEVAEGASVVVPFILFDASCDDRGGGEQGERRLSSCSTDAAGARTCSFVLEADDGD